MKTICSFYKDILIENFHALGRAESLLQATLSDPNFEDSLCPKFKTYNSLVAKESINNGTVAQDYLRS